MSDQLLICGRLLTNLSSHLSSSTTLVSFCFVFCSLVCDDSREWFGNLDNSVWCTVINSCSVFMGYQILSSNSTIYYVYFGMDTLYENRSWEKDQ